MTQQTAVSGLITEFLIQSVDNIVRIFPAWPRDKEAEFSNLRTRVGFLVSARQGDGLISNLTVESTAGGELQLVSPWDQIRVKYPDGSVDALTPDSRGMVSVSTVKGQKLEFIKDPILVAGKN